MIITVLLALMILITYTLIAIVFGCIAYKHANEYESLSIVTLSLIWPVILSDMIIRKRRVK